MSLTADPPAGAVAANGGISTHNLQNSGTEKLIFKVRSSNNNEYRVKPVFGFVEPNGVAPLEITRLAGPAREDKIVIQFAPSPPDATDPQAAFASVQQMSGNVTIPMTAT